MPAPPENVCDVLVLAAFGPELAAMRQALGGERGVRATARGEIVVATATIGVGLPAASFGTYAALERSNAPAALLLGTCGAYAGRGFSRLDVAVAGEVGLADPGAAEGRGALLEGMARFLQVDTPLSAALEAAGGKRARVATTLAVTTDDALAGRLSAAFGADVEHLEAYSAAIACAARGVRFASALGVANAVGATGRREWRESHEEAGARAAQVALAWLDAGCPGLR